MEIRAEAADVFAVVSDLRLKARLNPNIEVIRVELEGEEPVREGSVFYHRFRKWGRTLEYRSRCVRCEPPRLFETRGEGGPAFAVRVTVEPAAVGCRLTQEEAVEVEPEMFDALEPPPLGARRFRDFVRLLLLFPGGRPLGRELGALQRGRLARRLSDELQAWLEGIRQHVERMRPQGAACA